MNNKKEYAMRSVLLGMVVLNILGQMFFMRDGLDNEVKNQYAAQVTNPHEYVERAEIFHGGGRFARAFGDGYRMPGYPLFVSMFYSLSSQPLLAVRYAQIVLSSLIIVLAYCTLRSILNEPLYALVGSVAFALWGPFYYYSPILYAESCSMFVIAALFFFASRIGEGKSLGYLLMAVVCLAASIYLKPNHVLLFVPLMLFTLYVMRRQSTGRKHLAFIFSLSLLIALLLPWSLFVSLTNHAFIPLSTTQGMNLYGGSGLRFKYDRGVMEEGIHGKVAAALGLNDEHDLDSLEVKKLTAYELDRHYQRAAIASWMSMPLKTSLYGCAKIVHAFGFSLRDFRDAVLLIHFVLSVIMSVLLWKKAMYREWCIMFWGVLVIVSLQSFFFMPPQRFKTVLFDFPAWLIIILGSTLLMGGINLSERSISIDDGTGGIGKREVARVHRASRSFIEAVAHWINELGILILLGLYSKLPQEKARVVVRQLRRRLRMILPLMIVALVAFVMRGNIVLFLAGSCVCIALYYGLGKMKSILMLRKAKMLMIAREQAGESFSPRTWKSYPVSNTVRKAVEVARNGHREFVLARVDMSGRAHCAYGELLYMPSVSAREFTTRDRFDIDIVLYDDFVLLRKSYRGDRLACLREWCNMEPMAGKARVPVVRMADTTKAVLYMDFICGRTVLEILRDKGALMRDSDVENDPAFAGLDEETRQRKLDERGTHLLQACFSEEFFRDLDELVDAIHACRLTDLDIRFANIIVDDAGKPWMIDFEDAKVVSRWAEWMFLLKCDGDLQNYNRIFGRSKVLASVARRERSRVRCSPA